MRKVICFVLVVLCVLSANAQERKKVGLVLSGGGAKGIAHVGALKVIEEAKIPIDYIAGTSMGAIIGGLYSIGYTAHQLDSIVKSEDWSFLLSDAARRDTKTFVEKEEDARYVLTVPFNRTPKEAIPDGLIKGKNLEALFNRLTIGYHDSLSYQKFPIPYACVAVDLVKGEEVIFHSGSLAPTMRASMAIPAAFTPMRLDSMVLVDGGLVNNFPVDVAKQMGADLIIGVDVQNEKDDNDKVTTVADVVDRMATMLSRDKYAENLKGVDVYIKVDVEGFTAASFTMEALDTLNVRGEFAAREEWDELINLKRSIGISEDYIPDVHGPYKFLSDTNPIHIVHISFGDMEETDRLRLIEKCKLTEGSEMTMKQLNKAVDELYATQIYTNVSYTLNEVPQGYNLVFSMDDNRVNLFRFGLRFDWEEVASVLLNSVYHFNTRIPTTAALTARFGKRSGVRVDYQVLPSPLRFFNLSYSYYYNDINIYRKGRREYNTTFDHHLAEIGYSNIFNQDLKLGVGIRFEHYDYKSFLFNNREDDMRISPEGFFSYYALLRYETMDKKVYPTRGTSLQGDASLYTDNLFSYKKHSPFAALSLWWKTVYSVSERFAIIPAGYGRVLVGSDSPYPYLNAIGGDIPARYIQHQLPFEGINHVELVDNSVFIASVRLRQRLGNKHYVFLTGNYGLTNHDLDGIFKGRNLIGGSISYGYDSLFGPIEASLNYSNSAKRVGFYLNVGYKF